METHDLTPTEHASPTEHAPPTPGMPTVGLPYDGLRQIWDLFPDAHPGARTSGLPMVQQPAPNATLLLDNEAYMARVNDLVRREEVIAYARAQYEHAVLAPVPVRAQVLPAQPYQPQPEPAAPQQTVPAFVWKYGALALSTGGFIALAGVGVGAAAPGLAEIPGILTAAGQAVMGFAFLTALVVLIGLLFTGGGGSRGKGGGGTTVNIRKAVFRRNKFHG
ncbi:hypothetical protein [Streptomyces mirabilis]|uniref:Uncharacterized protein n=1 Tax=Streptomyces mirabilis TaxID=68239 RepID=A0ABU3V623_9ACTN|nr:hypothetical protein [Streptomyces mirabilis]MCX5355598.1 hypothetical protein [Streptomyces mirabilis]MDU9001244.1 hypothetical protein [Streptomyces mirabilis]